MEKKRNFFDWIIYGLEQFGEAICKIGDFFRRNWRFSFELRKVVLALPVVVMMIALAGECRKRLPEYVGIQLLASGEFKHLLDREVAITYMMAITVICLVLMFCSRKTIYPWMISLMSLLLPVLLILINVFPA